MSITPGSVSAIFVTRGDVDLSRILAEVWHAGIDDVIVWDNSAEREDLKTFGRYAAIPEARNPVLYFADDDIVVYADTIRALIAAYEPGVIVANMSAAWVTHRHMEDAVFVGAGAILDRDIPARALAKYDTLFPRDELFHLYPEAMVSVPSRIKHVDLCGPGRIEVLDWGYAPNRMNAQPWFDEWMAESFRRGRAVRDAFGGKE